jgi:glycosyltransferase involved in cell wall biosynthesis
MLDDLSALIERGTSLVEAYPDPRERAAALDRFRMPVAGSPPPHRADVGVPGLPASAGRPSRVPRVCIATGDLVGPVKNGGVGTACTMLAEVLAAAGQDVTICYAGPFEAGDTAHWRAYYAERRIAFEVPESSDIPLAGTPHTRASYETYQWLKRQQRFDVVQFPEMYGLGFYSLQAKRLGLSFHHTAFCVVLHSPTVWHRTENSESIESEDDLVVDHLERESVALADVLVSPTNYLLSWAREWGFRFPKQVFVQPYATQLAWTPRPRPPHRVDELVFFGRLEARKGLEIFCDALDELSSKGVLDGATVTFLGKIGRVRQESAVSYIERRTAAFGARVRLQTDLAQPEALAYLRRDNVLAVMPSLADNMPFTVLECLAEGIPFVSVASGGIPEMIAAEDRPHVLAEPEGRALAHAIQRALHRGAILPRAAHDPAAVRDQWIRWHEALAGCAPAGMRSARTPLVTVCMATRNRTRPLEQALETIRRQTYGPIEVVLVDDASDSADARSLLDSLVPEFASRGWQLVRQPAISFPGAARNVAAAHAHGEYILFMDDDNLARPEEVATFVAGALHSGLPILTCVLDQFRGDPADEALPAPTLRWLPLGPALAVGLLSNRFGDTNMLVRRDAFFRVGGFDGYPDTQLFEDWVFLARAARAGMPIGVVPEPLFFYRVWDGALTQSVSSKGRPYLRLAPYLEDESPERRALTLYAAGLHERAAALESSGQGDVARVRSLAKRFARAEELFIVGPGDVALIEPQQDLEVLPVRDGILLRSLGNDPIAWLRCQPPPFVHSIVRIDVWVPYATWLQLFWSTRDVPYPTEEQSTIVGCPPGRHVRWAEIPAALHVDRLRFDPASAPGNYVLHALEIRCESHRGSALVSAARRLLSRLLHRTPPMPARFRRRSGALRIDRRQ